MASTLDFGYLTTPTGILNIAEILILIGALISVAFTSHLFCELVDNTSAVYPELSTVTVRAIFQAFAVLCLAITIIILLVHIYGIRYSGQRYFYINRLCLIINIIMGLMMISIGICAAFWEDKLRRTPSIIRRGYYYNRYQNVLGEYTHPRPGAAAAAAAFGILAGILFLVEACTRPMLSTGASLVPMHSSDRPSYTVSTTHTVPKQRTILTNADGDRIIPIETVLSSSSNPPYRV